ncbi:hypothetical protein [Sulfitobacter sp. M22]|uniref:hypothetical protein n=1 Tax=Sulfitobacter sp. M22 TaxID=2675332 RepID=UPI001F2D7448|nr:hypothetical protein [Sulfitobacter sp. M22]MCF7728694.1 hypothetical protein [Sulfitobacter sp. M22]
MEEKSNNISSSDYVSLVKTLAIVCTKLDMLLERFDSSNDEHGRRFKELEGRVDKLESVKDHAAGKISVISFLVSGATAAGITTAVKFFLEVPK